jgi:hypothetical protein
MEPDDVPEVITESIGMNATDPDAYFRYTISVIDVNE